jgi:thymidine kinase
MSTKDDFSKNNTGNNKQEDADDLIDVSIDQSNTSKHATKKAMPKVKVRMEEPQLNQIFDEHTVPYVVRVSRNNLEDTVECNNTDVNSGDKKHMQENEESDSTDTSDEYIAPLSEGEETEESNDLIDLSPGESVARITNQTISLRDDDIERMKRLRNIIGFQTGRRTKYIPKSSKKRAKHPYGYLKIVFGSMYSGKSSELRTDRNDWLSIKGIRILVVNYSHDKRYTDEDMVMTHNKEGVKCISVEHLAEITNGECYDEQGNVVLPEDYDLILIDEAQFYDDLRDNIIHWVDILRKTVFVYGLDGDYRRQQFGQIMDLVPLCDKIVKKKANCMMCNNGTEALFTWRIENNEEDAVTVEIGSEDKYVALCRKHYNRLNKPKVVITGQIYSKK